MFCQQCGALAPDQSKFCKQCGRRLKSYISNKTLLFAAIAAVISVGASLLAFLPASEPMKAESSPTPLIVTASPSPSPKPTQTPKVVRPTLEPTIESEPTPKAIKLEPPSDSRRMPSYQSPDDYPYRHRPTPEFPINGSAFSLAYSANQLVFRWDRAPSLEVVKYRLRVERKLPFALGWKYWLVDVDANQNWYAMRFSDTGMYRWNMTPIFPNGSLGLATEWRTFSFMQ